MHFNKNRCRRAISMIEIMIIIGTMFVLSGITMSLMHVTADMSVQVHCTANLRSLWQMTKMYRIEQDEFPPNYPEVSFPTVFDTFDVPERTYGCFAYDEDDGREGDVYSAFYIQPTDDIEEDTVLCSCPYHDMGNVTVYVTTRGRGETAPTNFLTYDNEEVEPRQVFTGGMLQLWGANGIINIPDGVQVRQLASFTKKDHTYFLALKVLEDQNVPNMEIVAPPDAVISLVTKAGVVLLEADGVNGEFIVSLFDPDDSSFDPGSIDGGTTQDPGSTTPDIGGDELDQRVTIQSGSAISSGDFIQVD